MLNPIKCIEYNRDQKIEEDQVDHYCEYDKDKPGVSSLMICCDIVS